MYQQPETQIPQLNDREAVLCANRKPAVQNPLK